MVSRQYRAYIKMSQRKAIVFIDGSNFYHNSKGLTNPGERIDFNALSKLICTKYGLKLTQIRYYNGMPDIRDSKKLYYNHLSFLDKLKKEGIIVKTRKLKYLPGVKKKVEKGVDVLIAYDMIRKTLVENQCEVCILISGDADFIPAMEIIKNAHYEVIVCSPRQGFSNELRQGKFRYLILNRTELSNCFSRL